MKWLSRIKQACRKERLSNMKHLAILAFSLVGLSFVILFGVGLLQKSGVGRVDIPTVATEGWKAFVAAGLISSFGALSFVVLRRRERNALLTMVASDAAHVAERSVLYRKQERQRQGVSKSKIESVVTWQSVIRLFDLLENDRLKDDIFSFYERLDRAAPHFAQAFEAALTADVLKFDIQSRKAGFIEVFGHAPVHPAFAAEAPASAE